MKAIKPMQPEHVDEASAMIQRNLFEINSRDYSEEIIAYLEKDLSPEKLLEKMRRQHLFVAIEDGHVIGVGGLADFGNEDEPSYYGVIFFVMPELHRQGIGKLLVLAVEAKARKLGASKITVRAAIGARTFYEKLGYKYPDGKISHDKLGNYHMEKILSPK